jgi:hypothetical protein
MTASGERIKNTKPPLAFLADFGMDAKESARNLNLKYLDYFQKQCDYYL